MNQNGVFGTARWLGSKDLELNGFRHGAGPLLGDAGWRKLEVRDGFQFFSTEWARFPSEGHLCTVARTGAGKFRRVIKPNLLTLRNSIVVIDNKGETAEQTLKHRVEVLGQKVFLFDPYEVVPDAALPAGFKRSSFNPIDFIRTSDLSPFEAAMTIAQSFIKPSAKDPRWQIAAQLWLAANLIHVAFDPCFDADPDLRTFETAWAFATRPDLKDSALAQMETSSDAFVAAQAKSIREGKNKQGSETDSIEREFFIQCARIGSSSELQAAMKTSDLDFGQLRDEPITVYVVLPFRVAESQAGFFSMFLCCALDQIMARGPEKPGSGKPPVYFVMDEFLTQGRMERMLRAFREIRGYNVSLHAFVQDLGALKATYGDEWSTIIGNCGLLQYFGGTADLFTQEYFSKLTGQATLENTAYSVSSTFGTSSGSNASSSYTSGTSSSSSSAGASSGFNSSYSANTGINQGFSASQTSGTSRSAVAGTLVTPEQVGNLSVPHQLLFVPGLGCADGLWLPDAVVDFPETASPKALVKLQETTLRLRPCRTEGCPEQIPMPALLVNELSNTQLLSRQLFVCPACKGKSDSLCERVLLAVESAREVDGKLWPTPENMASALEVYVRHAASSYKNIGIEPGEFDRLVSDTDSSSDRSDPRWRRLLDPFGTSGRYPEIFGRFSVKALYRKVSWTLYDERDPDRPRDQNAYVLPSTRENWVNSDAIWTKPDEFDKFPGHLAQKQAKLREQMDLEMLDIQARVMQEPPPIRTGKSALLVASHPLTGKLSSLSEAAKPSRVGPGDFVLSPVRILACVLLLAALYLVFLFFSDSYAPVPARLALAALLTAAAAFLWRRAGRSA